MLKNGWKASRPANIGPQDVSRTSPSNFPRTSPKDPIWPSRRRPNLTSWGRLETTSRGRPNLTFKGRPQNVLRTSPRRPSGYSDLDVPKFFFNFCFRTYSIDQIYLKAFQHSRYIENPANLLRWRIFCKIS